MDNDDRYLSAAPNHLRRRAHWNDGYRLPGANILLISTIFLLSGLIMAALMITGKAESSLVWDVAIAATIGISGAGVAFSLAMCLSFTQEVPSESFNHDSQVRGLLVRIEEVTKHSTAGWEDDLWQAFFTIGQLIDEKKAVNSTTLSRELYDEIEDLVAELKEMIAAREALVAERRRLGIDPTVPGTEAQRIEAGLVDEMIELSMRPLLSERVAEIEASGSKGLEGGPRIGREES